MVGGGRLRLNTNLGKYILSVKLGYTGGTTAAGIISLFTREISNTPTFYHSKTGLHEVIIIWRQELFFILKGNSSTVHTCSSL